jgi:hypothetical protein
MRSVRSWYLCALLLALALPAVASDHADTTLLRSLGRHDARLTDLIVFTREDRLVLVLCSNPAIPVGARDYTFPPDLTLRIAIDNDSEVSFDDPEALAAYGGTVVRPDRIREEAVFEVTFAKGRARLRVEGMPGGIEQQVSFFHGLRDDPFIRGPRIGRNVAAVVLEMPLSSVLGPQPTLLVWATSKIPEVQGPISELAGRALRSQLDENMALNTLHPSQHFARLGVPPDVVIFDTSRPAAFPNGRELTDDVIDLVADPRQLADDAPFPAENDLPFLAGFPYLPPPQ